MEETQVKEEQQEESQEVSAEEIKQDYNPHKQSPCAAFLRAYKSYFIKNFNKVCQDKCTCDLCLNELDIEGDYLYDVMFNPDVDVSEGEVHRLFNKLIHHSAQFDVVLNQAWLQMIDEPQPFLDGGHSYLSIPGYGFESRRSGLYIRVGLAQ